MRAEAVANRIDHSAKLLAPRFVPLRAIPFTASFKTTCCDCKTEKTYPIGQLMRNNRLAVMTAEMIGEEMTCTRTGCGGKIEGDIDLAD